MPDRVFYDRLQDQIRHSRVERLRINVHVHGEPVMKTHVLDLEITPEEFELLLKRHLLRPRVFKRKPQEVAEPSQHLIGRVHVFVKQRRNRVERVEQKVRVKLHLQRLKLGLGDLQLSLRKLRLQSRDLQLLLLMTPVVVDHIADQEDRSVAHKPGRKIEENIGRVQVRYRTDVVIGGDAYPTP